MIIIVFLGVFIVLLGLINNCRDESIHLQNKYLYMKDSLYIVSSKIQHQASFENLDDSIYLGMNQKFDIIYKYDKGNYYQIYAFPFYISAFQDHDYICDFQYILDSHFELYINGIPITTKMIELYSNQKPLLLPKEQIAIDCYNEFWPCFSSKIDGFIL